MTRWFAAVALALFPALAWSHAGSNAFIFVDAHAASFDTRIDLAARDLDEILGLDQDGDGRVTWAEVTASERAVRDYARSHLRIAADGQACDHEDPGMPLQAVEHADGWYAVIPLRDRCAAAGTFSIDWSGVFDFDASHRAQLRLQAGEAVSAIVLSPSNRHFEFASGMRAISGWETFARYLREGVMHVLTGLDHLLFLAGLFLPVALERTREGWSGVATRRLAFGRAALIVSAFTVSHALTLCLVALGTVHPPTRLVESLVAFSVAFAGFNNLVPLVPQRRLALLAGGFGFIHGAAIGGALLELGLPASARVLALAAFNIGVECAQLMPVSVAVIATFRFRHSPAYRRWVLIPGSAIVTVFGLVWLVYRALGLKAPI